MKAVIYEEKNRALNSILRGVAVLGLVAAIIVSFVGNFAAVGFAETVSTATTSIEKYVITMDRYFDVADGTDKTPKVTGVLPEGETSIYASLKVADYDVSFIDSQGQPVTEIVGAGIYKICVTAKGQYEGCAEATFTVLGKPQELTVSGTKFSKYADSPSFSLNAKANGDGTGITYASSDPEVAAVSAEGMVDLKSPGRAVITVTTEGDVLSQPANVSVAVNVHPAKVLIPKKFVAQIESENQVRAYWKKTVGANKYEIRYSTSKSFKTGKYTSKLVNAKNKTTNSAVIKNLRQGKTYYIKVRAVTLLTDSRGNDMILYGKWSSTGKIKLK